jgi:hypothetical protein
MKHRSGGKGGRRSSLTDDITGPLMPGDMVGRSSREPGSRKWLKSHGDDWIERALMTELMNHRATLIREHNPLSPSNPYRTCNLAARLQIHNSALSAWSTLRQFPKSLASWRRLCRALGLTFEIQIRDRKTRKIIFGGLE